MVCKFKNGTFFEEYPKSQNTNPKVLNGWIYSLIGLHDYLKVSSIKRDKFYYKKESYFINR